MADRRRAGRGRPAAKDEPQSNELSSEDLAIAKFVRFNCPAKQGMFEGNEVHYFHARKAVDTLLESKKYGSAASNPKFAKRADAVEFLADLLARGLFCRARVLVPKRKDEPRRGDPKKELAGESPRVRRVKQKEAEESGKEGETAGESGAEQQQPKKDEEKRKKKVKLVVHDHQVFNDDNDTYIWIFDPTPFWKKVVGLLIVIGVIAGCLFPLWPDWMRLGVYYLSVTGIGLFGLLLGVALARTILFGIIYALTLGRHQLWILPNLTEDCGFFESFQPLYTYEYCPPAEAAATAPKKEKKEKKKKKDSDEEQPLVEDVKSEQKATPSSSSRHQKETPSAVPEDPEPRNAEETDPEEKYSKASSDEDEQEEDSAAEEDEVTGEDEEEEHTGSVSATASTGDSSEPVDVVKLDEEPSQSAGKSQKEEDKKTKEESSNKQQEEEAEASKPAAAAKPRRRRVRRADDDDYVMVQKTDD